MEIPGFYKHRFGPFSPVLLTALLLYIPLIVFYPDLVYKILIRYIIDIWLYKMVYDWVKRYNYIYMTFKWYEELIENKKFTRYYIFGNGIDVFVGVRFEYISTNYTDLHG